jgi:hypothetical protein
MGALTSHPPALPSDEVHSQCWHCNDRIDLGAVVPLLVPGADLAKGIALSDAGVTVSLTIEPALDGLLVSALGIAAPFWLDAFSEVRPR